MVVGRVKIIAPGSGSGQVRLHTLKNGLLRSALYSALFGKSGQCGYLSPLGMCIAKLDLAVKMQTSLFSLVEAFSPTDNRLTSVLRQAAEALRLEIFGQPWTEQHLFEAEHMEVFNWKTTARTIPAFIKDCEAVLGRLDAPLFGGLPKLANELAEIAMGPSLEQQQEAVNKFMAGLDCNNPTKSIIDLLALLSQQHLIPRKAIMDTVRHFHGLKPVRAIENEAAAILEAKAYVMGVVIAKTRSVSSFMQNCFSLLGFAQYHTDEIRALMLKMGFEAEWHSFDLSFQELQRAGQTPK